MAEESVQFLLRNVENLVVEHYQSVSGSGTELNLLSGELKAMLELLRERERGGHPMLSLKQYERKVRDVVHEAEDILDECLTRAALKYSGGSLAKYFSPKYRRLANKVHSFRRTTVKPLLDKITQLPSPAPAPTPPASQPLADHQITLPEEEGEATTSTQFVNQELNHQTGTNPRLRRGTVVGFEEEAEAIIELLSSCDEESTQIEVISIIGMPGLGKTTLAWKIYEDARLKRQFEKIIWVTVSQNYDKRKVFLSILKSLTNEDYSEVAAVWLAKAIGQCLLRRKFLLFLDDVWKPEDWVDIEAALPVNNRLGRVVITSRNRSVGESAKRSWKPRGLGFLDPIKCWELLQLQVFNDLDDCPKDLIGPGKMIAFGCGGVPLAVVVIGGILSRINSTSEKNERTNQWEMVSKSVVKFLHGEDSARTRNIIALTYDLLSLDLKYCFLYLGIFPKSSHIEVQRLIRMWIAEGFIRKRSHTSFEKAAYSNLKELIDMNLVMVDDHDRKLDGYIKTCRVHDLIHEFCKDEASLDNHNLFQEMELSASEGTFQPLVSDIQNRRRICIHSHVESFLKEKPQGPRVHSFLCFAKDAVSSLPPDTSPIPPGFTRLRVLDVNPIKLSKFPSKLPELIHLRYISLSADGKDFKLLPKGISELWNLQSITIEAQCQTFEIKANVWKMMHLRHLKSKAAIILQKNKLDGKAGEALQSLSRLSAQCCTQEVFSKAKNLHNLGIRGDLNSIPDADCFKQLQLLQKLKLVHDVHPRAASDKPLRALPDHSQFPVSLSDLQLSGTALQWNQIHTLEKLPGLKVLKLKDNAFVGKRWRADQGCFGSLDILVIADNEVVDWTANEAYFPSLRSLVLKDCNKLDQIPFQLSQNLQLLHVERVSESAAVYARKINEEKQKLQGTQSGGFQLIIVTGA